MGKIIPGTPGFATYHMKKHHATIMTMYADDPTYLLSRKSHLYRLHFNNHVSVLMNNVIPRVRHNTDIELRPQSTASRFCNLTRFVVLMLAVLEEGFPAPTSPLAAAVSAAISASFLAFIFVES